MKPDLFWPMLIVYVGALIAIVVAASPGWSADMVSWGGTNCRIAAADGPHIAEITCSNILTGSANYNTGSIDLDGLSVTVEAMMGAGKHPDTFTITPPEGYIAAPQSITLDEGASGVIRVFAMDAVPMG